MVTPMGPIGGMPNSEIPTEAMKRLRPMLFFAVLGCTLSLIGKFIGREGSTAMTDIFPIVFGFLVLFSKNHANTCGMLFLLFSAMATLFAIYNLIFELAEKDTGGAHFFSADCEAKRDQISKSGAVIKVCSNEYIEGDSESCNKHFTCLDGSDQPHDFTNGAYLYTKENVGQKLSIIFRDACTPYSVVGHIALIFSVFFNFMAAYMGWKIFEVTRQAFENPPEEEPLNDGQYDGGVRPPLRNNPASLFGGPMGPQQQGATVPQGTGGRSGGTPQQQQQPGAGTGQQGAFTAFSGQGQRLGAS